MVQWFNSNFSAKLVANLNRIGESKMTQSPTNEKNFLNVEGKNPVTTKIQIKNFAMIKRCKLCLTMQL